MKDFADKFLSGRTAVVTGAALKLGASIAEELAGNGAAVVVNYNNSEAAANTIVNKIRELGSMAIAVQGDVSNEQDVVRLLATAEKKFGSVDILINNAGPWIDSPLKDLKAKDWDWILNCNLKSAYLTSKYASVYMKQKGWGRIINISANSSNFRNHSVYGLAKNAINTLTEALALELGHEITVNGIAPGMIDDQNVIEKTREDARRNTPLKRLVSFEEVAKMAAFMCSPLFDTVTGQIIVMDSGRSIPQETFNLY